MRLPRVSAPVHGIDFSQMPPQRPSSAHLNSANRVDVSCDLSENEISKRVTIQQQQMHSKIGNSFFFFLITEGKNKFYLRQGSIRTRFPGILQHNN